MIRKKNFAWRFITLILYRERSVVINRFYSCLTNKDLSVQRSNSLIDTVENILRTLSPHGTNYSLERIGGINDGSYVLPTIFCNSDHFLISGGIENNNNFEFEMAATGVTGIQVDNSIDKPPKIHPNLDFVRKTISNQEGRENITLSELIIQAPRDKKLILKLDIEGAEIAALNQLQQHELEQFECLLLELHDLSEIENKQFAKTLNELLQKLQRSFISVFVQANNACLAYNLSGTLIPDNIEVTFVKKELSKKLESHHVHRIRELTSRNREDFANINIDHFLYRHLI